MTTTKNAQKESKKRVVKKSARALHKKQVLVCAQGDQCFWINDGKIISNLIELEQVLVTMAEDVFKHHVTKERNDFADWIEYVLQDTELATSIRSAKKPNTARTLILRRLKLYDLG